MVQTLLPIFSEGFNLITNIIGYEKKEEQIYYFLGQAPIFSHDENDIDSFRFITSQFVVNGSIKQMDIVRAFGVTEISVKRSVKKLREEGVKGFSGKKQVIRAASVLTPDVIKKAQGLLDKSNSVPQISEKLNIKADTLRKAIRAGRLKKKK